MASTQITTVDQSDVVTHQRAVVVAGSRLYAVWSDSAGDQIKYAYSDNGGSTWTGETQIKAANWRVHAFYDSVNGRLNFVYAGGNYRSGNLAMRAITSNVTSGSPGSLTTETVIDSAGTNVGVQRPYAFHSATSSNPRYWIVAQKFTADGVSETRAWYCAAGSAADTAGNWSNTNFTNLGGNSTSGGIARNMALGAYWKISSADKVTIVMGNGDTDTQYEAVTFDPTATTPTPGSTTLIVGATGSPDFEMGGMPAVIAAKDDYLVFGRLDLTNTVWDFWKTVNGTTWTNPTGWTDLTMGRAQLGKVGSNLYLVHTSSYNSSLDTVSDLKWRKITTSSDTMGSATTFSDTQAHFVSVPESNASAYLYAVYRGSTGSPYTLRVDSISAPEGQTLLPDADTAAGGWTTEPLWSKLNDSSDSTYITATAT